VWVLVCVFVVVVAVLVFFGRSWWTALTVPSERESAFEGVVLTTETGEPLSLALTEGKPLIVVSWATWCPECLTALRSAAQVKDRYGEQISVVAVNRKEERTIINDYRNAYSLPTSIVYSLDSADRYFLNVDGISMPEVLVYDAKGTLIKRYLDAPQLDVLETVLAPLFSAPH
jgi:thiol-disulfide isomerase/thioredoxin